MLPLNRLLREGLRRYHLERGVKAKQSVSLWESVAGPTVAEVTQADDVRDGILFVYTRSSAWSQELSLLKEPLIARINESLEANAVTDIRFQVKRFRKVAASEEAAPAPARELTEEERASLKALAESLDDGLGERIASVAERQLLGHTPGATCADCGGPLHRNETRCPFCRAR